MNRPAEFTTGVIYWMTKVIDDELFFLEGGVKNEERYLEIYKNDVLVDDYVGWTDSTGTKIFM